MGLILLGVCIGLITCLPIKCYNDGRYRMKCLEMRGTISQNGDTPICNFKDSK